MPFTKASRMCSISILPVQGAWMMRTLGGYCMRFEPARSAAA